MGLFVGSPKHQDIPKILEIFKTNQHIRNVFVEGDDTGNFFRQLASNFTVIDAAGGVVQNEKDDILLIRRRGVWDLPKGKVENGERVEAAAVREVQEETGLADVKREVLIATTYHTYTQQGQGILKRTFWYSMRSSGSHVLTPQLTEDISTVEWVCRNNLPEYLKNTYGNIRDVLGTLNIPVVP